MTPLHRHQLAWLTPAGWQRTLGRPWDAVANECLAHWAEQRLPLVVTRQPSCDDGGDTIAMGLPAPGRWDRRRLVLRVARADVLYFDEFPRAEQIVRLLPASARPAWRKLCAGLQACGAVARVHGSYGWKHLSGLDHVRAGSDIDVWVAVAGVEGADAAATLLQAFPAGRARLDGELVFEDGAAVAWREWLAWRGGHARALLVKRIDGCSLSRTPGSCTPSAVTEPT
ncbi:MAG TPA: malonate decarboxylase holo-[acyl-carrier-protein] synthase [Albitalea sp.]|uniref:malonate decarboxylase holo-[acyl-carrier-protein] synthase n=1 Tax=Piscinibacter sp. TaxID=1903157 RepID=UPI002ED0570A